MHSILKIFLITWYKCAMFSSSSTHLCMGFHQKSFSQELLTLPSILPDKYPLPSFLYLINLCSSIFHNLISPLPVCILKIDKLFPLPFSLFFFQFSLSVSYILTQFLSLSPSSAFFSIC